MSILLLDRGNHSLKAAVLDSGRLVERFMDRSDDNSALIDEIVSKYSPGGAAVSSVVQSWSESTLKLLDTIFPGRVVNAGDGVRLPFDLLVDNPGSLGPDRICAACGLFARGEKEGIIIDAGTAITVDLLTRDGFAGGAIFPGIDMALAALSENTSALPRLENRGTPARPPGSSTEDAIIRGVFWGTIGAVDRLVGLSADDPGDTGVFLTGGSAGIISAHLEAEHIVLPDLVFEGLALLFSLNAG